RSSKDHFQAQLEKPRRRGCQRTAEIGRRNVIIRYREVSVVGDVEALGSKLEPDRFSYGEGFERREIDVRETGTTHRVAAFGAEFSGLGGWIEPAEGGPRYPEIGRVRSGVGVGNEIGAAGIEAADFRSAALKGSVCAVVDGEGSPRG